MKITTIVALASGLGLALAIPQVRADDWNQLTNMTFSEPTEIPGHVLPAGTYTFKLINTDNGEDTVEVRDQNSHVEGIFLTIPDYRMKLSGKTVVTFSERPEGAPAALKAWFYPGENFGHRFVYPRSEAAKLARANNESVAAMPDEELKGFATRPHRSHITAAQPSGEDVDSSQAFAAHPDESAEQR
jgi:hypothetical protein